MATIVTVDDVRNGAVRRDMEGGALRRTTLFESDATSPHAFLVEYDPNRVSRQHFHECDQFQIIVAGSGKIGHHPLVPYSVHFSRAHTPYGPLTASPDGMTFLTLRRRWDKGALRLPEARPRLEAVPGRRPWQVTERVTLGDIPEPGEARVLPIDGIRNDEGLAGYTVELGPNASAYAPDPSRGEGQYVAILEGSLVHAGREHNAMTVVDVPSSEGPFHVVAGSGGLKALALTFPRTRTAETVDVKHAEGELKTWQCVLCAFVYDEEAGLPEEGIAPGTRWTGVPQTWTCPDCAATKSDFQMVEI